MTIKDFFNPLIGLPSPLISKSNFLSVTESQRALPSARQHCK